MCRVFPSVTDEGHYTLKVSLKCCDICPDTWEEAAKTHTNQWCLINTGVTAYNSMVSEASQECQQQKSRGRNVSMSDLLQVLCPHHNRVFIAQVELISNLQTTASMPAINLLWSSLTSNEENSTTGHMPCQIQSGPPYRT